MSSDDTGPNAIHAVETIRDILKSQWPTGSDAVQEPPIVTDFDYEKFDVSQFAKSNPRWVIIIPGDDNVETWFGGQEYWHTLSIRFMIKSKQSKDLTRISNTVRTILRDNIRITPVYTQLIYRNSTNEHVRHGYVTHLTYTLEWQDTTV